MQALIKPCPTSHNTPIYTTLNANGHYTRKLISWVLADAFPSSLEHKSDLPKPFQDKTKEISRSYVRSS